jgi:hypothetical protein
MSEGRFVLHTSSKNPARRNVTALAASLEKIDAMSFLQIDGYVT